jgi:hypothetical protein
MTFAEKAGMLFQTMIVVGLVIFLSWSHKPRFARSSVDLLRQG